MKIKFLFCVLMVCLMLGGCASNEPARFGPDPYSFECVDGNVWIVSEHGRTAFGTTCAESKVGSGSLNMTPKRVRLVYN